MARKGKKQSQESQMSMNEIEQALMDSHTVEDMTRHPGWQIIRKYLVNTIRANNRLWLLSQKNDDLENIRFEAARCYAMLSLVENFKSERKKLEEIWFKLEGLVDEVPFDVDNESPQEENY